MRCVISIEIAYIRNIILRFNDWTAAMLQPQRNYIKETTSKLTHRKPGTYSIVTANLQEQ